jgi:hypothetical protein
MIEQYYLLTPDQKTLLEISDDPEKIHLLHELSRAQIKLMYSIAEGGADSFCLVKACICRQKNASARLRGGGGRRKK